MPDITMCLNSECDKRDSCYRFVAIPSDYQSYGSFRPEPDGECLHFWELIDDYRKRITSEQL